MTVKEFESKKGEYTLEYLNALASLFETAREYCRDRKPESFDCTAYVAKTIKNQWGGINGKIMDISIDLENLAFKRNVDYQMFKKTSAFDEIINDIEICGGKIFKILIENIKK